MPPRVARGLGPLRATRRPEFDRGLRTRPLRQQRRQRPRPTRPAVEPSGASHGLLGQIRDRRRTKRLQGKTPGTSLSPPKHWLPMPVRLFKPAKGFKPWFLLGYFCVGFTATNIALARKAERP